MTTIPFGLNMLVRHIPSHREIGGIIIPDSFIGVSQECEVLAVGEGAWNTEKEIFEPMEIKVGERILVGKWAGRELNFGEVVEYIVPLNEIIGTLSSGNVGDWSKRLNLLHNHVLIEWERARRSEANGRILRPAQYQDMHYTGRILQIGPDVNLSKYPIMPGDRIFFDQFGSHFREKNWKEGSYSDEKRYACILDEDVILTRLPERVEFELVGDR
jgi:chaperonin GroES